MATMAELERRLSTIEEVVERLRIRLEGQTTGKTGLESLIGSFRNDPDFAKVIEYGRLIREGKMQVPGIDP